MMLRRLSLAFALALAALGQACNSNPAAEMRKMEGNLTFEGFSLGVRQPNGRVEIIDNNRFRKGETMALVLHKVSGFVPNKQGEYEYNMDLVVKKADGQVLREETELFGLEHKGPLDSANVAIEPHAFLGIHEHDPKGRYIVIVKMYDNVGGGSVTQQAVISVE